MDEIFEKGTDLPRLISKLRQERLLVSEERRVIQRLNERIADSIRTLSQDAWVNAQQRFNLDASSRADATPETCYRRSKHVGSTTFVQAKQVFEHQAVVQYGDFLRLLRSQPEQLAHWIVTGEKLVSSNESHIDILQSIMTGLCGCLVFPEDVNLTLTLLKQLAYLQLVSCDNPRRLLRHGSCSFAKMYFLFHENLHSARLFLISTLQQPIMKLIANSEFYLDIDPDKTISRFSAPELKDKFGTVGSLGYLKKTSEYRTLIISTLLDLVNCFVTSLQDNIHCFPVTIAWLVWQIGKMMAKSFGENSKEVNAVASDLIFASFICPAIINPERYGISDAPISEIARHNLTQVARIIQMLALYKYEAPEPKVLDLFGRLFSNDNGGMVLDVVEVLLHQYSLGDGLPPIRNTPGVNRNFALFTEQELFGLISFLQKVHSDNLTHPNDVNSASYNNRCGDANSLDHLIALVLSLSESQGHQANSFRSVPNSPNGVSKRNILNRVAKSQLSRANLCNSNHQDQTSPIAVIIPMCHDEAYPIGLLSEQKVLNMSSHLEPEMVKPAAFNSNQIKEKRTHFSISNDDGSIGNTSDNLEAISEAASNHSADSSIEMENEDQNDQDNLSDMVSANVSGRGSPNISGRDTPSSQVTENEDVRQPEIRQESTERPRRITVKQIRSEIDDKFCKFEIKKLLEGDETVSIISDTWSTDVLASDSETVDASDNQNQSNFSPIVERPPDNIGGNLLEISETHSESAWSTDVLASDTERMTEVDNDDVVSVAPSDDTARSDDVAPSDEARNDFEDNATAGEHRRSSAPGGSNNYDDSRYPLKIVEYNNNSVLLNSSISKITDLQNVLTKRIGNKSASEESVTGAIPKGVRKTKYHDPDIQLSNSSLNSSSSGSSNGSENRRKPFQQKQPQASSSGVAVATTETWNSLSESASENSGFSTSTLLSPSVVPSAGGKAFKSTASTGAIPKSISFDTSADKSYKDGDSEEQKKRSSNNGGFFGKFKMGFRSRRGKFGRSGDDYGVRFGNGTAHDDEISNHRTGFVYYPKKDLVGDSSEDILAKYRSKPNNETNHVNNIIVKPKPVEINDRELKIDYNMNHDFMNTDCKRKLRLVLSNSQEQHHAIFDESESSDTKKYLQVFLRMELGKAKNLKQWSVVARTAEALRCVQTLDSVACRKLFEILREEYRQRFVYVEYLQTSRRVLLETEDYLNLLLEELRNDRDLCETNLIELCARTFLERRDLDISDFCGEFKSLTLVDEKNDLLTNFLDELYDALRKDVLWQDSTVAQIALAQMAIEESVMTRVYLNALYPNGDGDRDRDGVLYDHLKKLSTIITPNHKDLQINKIYLNECPWSPAQEALKTMAAYRTPRDKVGCVVRCATAIMDLLSLAQDRGSTAADDFTPVLVYVIIMANPKDILSTIQYVNGFYGNRISGEDEYWWTQFCSAVEHTKTMDYSY